MVNAKQKMQAARTSLVLESPFFGMLALSLHVVEDAGCGTAWTDGRSIGYDPSFIEPLTHAQCTALVAHEVMHCACGHPWRRDGRNPKGWNIAADKAINQTLRDSGFTLPEGALYPNAGEDGKSSEWYYARLPESDKQGQGSPQAGQGPSQSGQGPSGPDPLGEVRDAPTGQHADGTPAPTEQEWKQKAAEALQQTRLQGKALGGLTRAVQEALKPQIDIRALLLRFFSERSTGDYSWTRPNTRYIAQGLYLPALESKSLGNIAVFIDTSGSVDQVSLAFAAGIVQSVLDETDPKSVTLYFADTKVCHVERLEKGEPLTWKPKGGGGTDFCDVLQAIDDEGEAVCAVCISDLYGTFPEQGPGVPVIWLSTTDQIAPFGETVPIGQ